MLSTGDAVSVGRPASSSTRIAKVINAWPHTSLVWYSQQEKQFNALNDPLTPHFPLIDRVSRFSLDVLVPSHLVCNFGV
jgi:hypothetical protein